MSTIVTILFVMLMLISTFMQAENNPQKKYVGPALTAVCGLLVLMGAITGNIPLSWGIILFIALLMLAASDFMFEQSANNENLFVVTMILGVLSGFMIGILLNVTAYAAGTPLWLQALLAFIAIIASVIVYRYLEVEPGLKVPIYIYLVQAVILLTGGLSSFYIGHYAFAIWGITIFITDSLVGIRAFPSIEKPIRWLDTRRILFLIIVLYYAAQYALVTWAL